MLALLPLLFQLSTLPMLERPLPFALGLVAGSGLLPFNAAEPWRQRLLRLESWLSGLFAILIFDWLRLAPRDFQLLLHSRQSLLIICWLLALLLMAQRANEDPATPMPKASWWLGWLALLLLLNMPILRELAPVAIPLLPFTVRFHFVFALQLLVFLCLAVWFSEARFSFPMLVFLISSCWIVFSESRFLSVSLMMVDVALWAGFGLPGCFRLAKIAGWLQSSVVLALAVLLPICVVLAPWIHRDWPGFARLLFAFTSSRFSATWGLNLWYPQAVGLAHITEDGISSGKLFHFLSSAYYTPWFQALRPLDGQNVLFYLGHAHSGPIQDLIRLAHTPDHPMQALGAGVGLLGIAAAVGLASREWIRHGQKHGAARMLLASGVLLMLAFITTESVPALQVIPMLLLLAMVPSVLAKSVVHPSQQLALQARIWPLAVSPAWLAVPYLIVLSAGALRWLLGPLSA
jgi:hypothetical protein